MHTETSYVDLKESVTLFEGVWLYILWHYVYTEPKISKHALFISNSEDNALLQINIILTLCSVKVTRLTILHAKMTPSLHKFCVCTPYQHDNQF